MALATFFAFLAIIITIIYFWVRRRYSTFEEQGFLHDKPEFPFGNVKGITKNQHLVEVLKKTYDKFSKKAPIYGLYMFLSANYIVTDLDLIKDILIKNFDTFRNRGIFNSKESDPLTGHLFTIEDQEWRNMRHKLTPTFTSGKMKMMFNTILDVSRHMIEKLKTGTDLEFVDVKRVTADLMIDVIGNVAFGLEMHAIEDPDCKFRQMTKKIFSQQNFFARALLFSNFRTLARKLKLRVFPKDVSDFFRGIVRETVEYRLKNNIERNDMLSQLMKIGTEGREGEEKLTMDEIAAQCFIFFVAGHEASSSASTFALFYLSKNPEIQERLRDEIKSVVASHDNKVTYEAMQEMKYLEMVIDETLRIMPPAPQMLRKASHDYQVPNTKLVIPKDSLVFIPIYLIHSDPTYYPQPEKFDPERFNEENIKNRHPMSYIPFGDGPRNCIGNRFGLMQAKISLIQLLLNFRFHPTSKTPEKIIINPKSPIVSPLQDIILRAEKL